MTVQFVNTQLHHLSPIHLGNSSGIQIKPGYILLFQLIPQTFAENMKKIISRLGRASDN